MKTANLSINCKRELDTDILYARFPNCPQTDLLYIKRFWNETSVMAKTFLIFLTICGAFFSVTGLISSIQSIIENADSYTLF